MNKTNIADLFLDLVVQGATGNHAMSTRPASPTNKGSLSRMVEQLVLETDMSYADIAAKVKEVHPEANTSTKSVASVACVMRSKGHKVPLRIRFNH